MPGERNFRLWRMITEIVDTLTLKNSENESFISREVTDIEAKIVNHRGQAVIQLLR